MRNVIEDLEALKELNDELEESHIENEKQLQAEIGTQLVYIKIIIYLSDLLDYKIYIPQIIKIFLSGNI
jgi:dynactin 1